MATRLNLPLFFCVFLISFLFSNIQSAFGQTFYELTYSFETEEGNEDYQAFLMSYGDGTGVVRITFTVRATGEKNIVEYDVAEMYDDENIELATQFAFICSNPVQIKGSTMYPADNFVFQKNPETGFFEPFEVISADEETAEGEEVTGHFQTAYLLNEADLTPEFIQHYFIEEDEEYQNILVNEVRPITVEQKATKLHLVIVANTLDQKIGKTCVIDKESITSLFEEITGFLEIGLSTQVVDGKNFSRKNVDLALSSVRPGQNDIVVFYYSGHGFNDPQGRSIYPSLDLRDKISQDIGGMNSLNIEDIFQLVKAKGARLNLVLSDCCNNDPFSSNSIGSEGASLRTSSIGWNKNFCAELFLKSKQSILMTAASKGQLSAGNVADGGFFTFNLRENIEKSVGKLAPSNVVNWPAIVTQTQKQTTVRANQSLCRMPDGSVPRCAQKPVYSIAPAR